jgi:GT2 family glycosyltransferase
MNKVYIVLVNYNNAGDTIECLESLLKSNYQNFQVFVVDNSVDDGPVGELSNWATNDSCNLLTSFDDLVFPLVEKPVHHRITTQAEFAGSEKPYIDKLTIIRAKNDGFAAANNVVLNYILNTGNNADLVWVLNNDTVIPKDTLSNLVNFYQQNESKKYLLSCKLKYYDKPRLLQAVAGRYNIWLGKHYHIGSGEADNGQYDHYQPQQYDYIVGASIFLPLAFLKEAGLMCEDYFLYFEELDWISKGKQMGYSIALVPNAIVYHKEGASIMAGEPGKRDTSIAEYYSITNRVRFIKKWYPYALPTVFAGVVWALVKRVFQGKFKLVKKSAGAIFKILYGV